MSINNVADVAVTDRTGSHWMDVWCETDRQTILCGTKTDYGSTLRCDTTYQAKM